MEDEINLDASPCPGCGAENEPLGYLGSRAHFSCRNCGLGWSAPSWASVVLSGIEGDISVAPAGWGAVEAGLEEVAS